MNSTIYRTWNITFPKACVSVKTFRNILELCLKNVLILIYFLF